MPNKFLGQHFLNDANVTKKIIGALKITSGDTVLEIGPGHGELTRPLAEACRAADAKLFAIEKDAGLAEGLKIEGVEIITGDALEHLKSSTYTKVVGNIPYYLTGKLLRIMSEQEIRPSRAVLMVQKEVAERMIASPPKMNRLAASIQFWAEPKIVARVSKEQFTPPPEVDSAIIALVAKTEGEAIATERYYATLRALFAQPRKTVLNNVAAMYEKGAEKQKMIEMLQKLGVDPTARPQNLTIENIVSVAKAVNWG